MRAIRQLNEWLAKVESGFLVFLLFLMVFLAFSQVLLRNFLSSGFLWTDLFLRQLVLWVGFLGASLAVRERRHISIDVLPQFLPATYRPWAQVLVNLCAGLISVFLTLAAWKFVQMEMEFTTILFLDLPAWIFQTILPFSFSVISLRYFLHVFDDSIKLWKKQ
ncbi:MAG: TRAP transporter small permease [Nitrospinota bacterium]|jgi:TRAP-type C4-dicarboxylate transport system permease small subunit|nr:TRAP transporter small permease [Nitrospinota bacterium]